MCKSIHGDVRERARGDLLRRCCVRYVGKRGRESIGRGDVLRSLKVDSAGAERGMSSVQRTVNLAAITIHECITAIP